MVEDTADFVAAFEATTLPREQWTHAAHLRVAWWYARTRPYPDSLDAMRAGILRYNKVIGVETTDDSGYHETVTVAWMCIMHGLVRDDPDETDFDRFCTSHPDVLDKLILLRHYSRACLESITSRTSFVEPDVTPLPTPNA